MNKIMSYLGDFKLNFISTYVPYLVIHIPTPSSLPLIHLIMSHPPIISPNPTYSQPSFDPSNNVTPPHLISPHPTYSQPSFGLYGSISTSRDLAPLPHCLREHAHVVHCKREVVLDGDLDNYSEPSDADVNKDKVEML